MSDTPDNSGFTSRVITILGRTYRLGIQEQGAASPEGRTIAVVQLQKEGSPILVEQRLRAGWEKDDDLWLWAEGVARAHALRSMRA